LSSGVYFGLNPVGARIWSLAVAGSTAAEVAAQLVREYAVSPEQAAVDVDRLLAELQQHDLLQRDDG
jgi:hypothetical protein